ncbi:L-lactate dehydrogenase [Aspergillus eucalypticola CBS 122712]|uniref:L-lactate dehydrogenase (cytochrome) n=1 Tax=Aspergillus eucalypticola (strain CBS 122712 / IBT 29274) TaxID=1448314 RepID=A0A317V1R4_ASPEC|nr:L-lactate dehydrogenase [Aspergillus eucalypticola CBS 122712]PWY67028.1 L-lactate dehydrogenase [Aspergillus eucalypticola CBS 122712]
MSILSREEVEKHSTRESCWVAIHGSVYDVTEFLDEHPGGAQVILRCAGKDGTADFDSVHDKDVLSQALPPSALKGIIQPDTLVKASRPLPKTSATAEENPPPPLSSIINLNDFEKVAQQHLSPHAWAYYYSGADDEISKREGQEVYQRLSFRPRILRSIRSVDTATSILGQSVSLPVYMSPCGIAKFAHPDGECAMAVAAGEEGLAQVLANGSSMSIDAVRAAGIHPNQPLFQQVYVNKDIQKSEETVRRAVKAGASGFWITVDSPVVGKREMDERLNLEVQARDSSVKGQGVAKTMASSISPYIDWDILKWIRGLTDLPVVIKGIQCVEDAVLAYQHGVQGIVLSNHGGRSQDTAQPPLVTLLEIRRYAPHLIESNMQIFIDGGIRRGTDVLKALALGATAVGLGRPFLFSLAAGYGADGNRRAIQILRQEIEMNMVFLGVTKLSELGPHLVNSMRLERDVVGSVKL